MTEISNPILISSNSFTEGKDGVVRCLKLGAGGVITKSIYIGKKVEYQQKDKIVIQNNNLYNNTTFSRYSSEAWYNWFASDFKDYNNIIPNIYGRDIFEIYEYIVRLSNLGIKTVELGISCPNTGQGISDNDCIQLIHMIKMCCPIRIIVKFSVSYKSLCKVEKYISEGIDTITLSDTIPGILYKDKLFYRMGCSGEQIKPLVLREIQILLNKYPNLNIIGVGGIQTFEDVDAFIKIGCKCVQLCSVLYIRGVQYTKNLITKYVYEEGMK